MSAVGKQRPGTVLVTGSSRGLGLAVSKALLASDWHVLAAMRNPDKCVIPRAAGRLIPLRLDLLSQESIDHAASTAHALARSMPSGQLDAIVLNAGVAAMGTLEDTPVEAWADIFQTNVFGPMALTRALLPSMRETGGRIIVVSSEAAIYGFPGVGPYAASKAALSRWAQSLSHEVRPFGIKVTILEPGVHNTDIVDGAPRYNDESGSYAALYSALDRLARVGRKIARSPSSFADHVVRALNSPHPASHRPIGADAWLLHLANRLLPTRMFAGSVHLATRPVRSRHNNRAQSWSAIGLLKG